MCFSMLPFAVLFAACTSSGDKRDMQGIVEPIDDTGAGGQPEECNGADDDGDGEIDEGLPDDNDNGRSDCFDLECPPLDLGFAGTVNTDDACTAAANLSVTVTDVCVADCLYGPAEVAVQVWNSGLDDVGAGTLLALYANDEPPRLVATYTLPAVNSGVMLQGVEFPLDTDDIGLYGFVAVVDDDGTGLGTVTECVEVDNSAEWIDVFCP